MEGIGAKVCVNAWVARGAKSDDTEPRPEAQMTQEGMPQEVHLSVDHSVAAAMHVAVNTNLTSGLLTFLPEAERWAHNLWLQPESWAHNLWLW